VAQTSVCVLIHRCAQYKPKIPERSLSHALPFSTTTELQGALLDRRRPRLLLVLMTP